ncbi:MAG: polysaccharide biosynthesis protein [Planctomycetota bacterium]|nr:MAG: polysaccharide biosynthesis protein [Planctomycetota bacterium]
MSAHLSRLGKHSAVLFSANLLTRGAGILLIPVITARLTSDEFSYWEAMLLAAQLLGMVAAHGITAALMWTLKTGAETDETLNDTRSQRAIRSATTWIGLAALAICGGGAFFGPSLARLTTAADGLGTALALLLLAQALRLLTYPAEGVLKLRFRSPSVAAMAFSEAMVQLLGSIFALVVLDAGLLGMAWANFAAAALRLTLALVWVPEMRKPLLDFALIKPMVHYGLPLMPGAVASVLLSLSDRWFFNRFGMASEGGLYAYGDKWARMVEFLLVLPLVGMWPAVYFNIAKEPDAKAQFGRIASLFAALGGSLAFVLTVMGPIIARLFDESAGEIFAAGAAAIGVLTAGYVLLGMNEVARAGFQITGRTRRTALAMVGAVLLNVLLNALLIPRHGMLGASWATTLSYGTALVFTLWLSRRVYRQEWEFGPLLHVTLVLVGGAWAISMMALPESGLEAWLWRVPLALAGPLLLLGSGFLRGDERAALFDKLGSLIGRVLPGRS